MELLEKARKEAKRLKKEEKRQREEALAQLEVISEESNHSWKQRKA